MYHNINFNLRLIPGMKQNEPHTTPEEFGKRHNSNIVIYIIIFCSANEPLSIKIITVEPTMVKWGVHQVHSINSYKFQLSLSISFWLYLLYSQT